MRKAILGLLIASVVVFVFTRALSGLAQEKREGPRQGPYTHQIYSASSRDGLIWTHDNVLLLDHASVPCAIVTENKAIRVYYVDPKTFPENVNCAESIDRGNTFKVLGCTIANRSGTRAVDPSIVRLADGRYRLYYYAVGASFDQQPHTIYAAISEDGVHFTEEDDVFTYPGLVDPDVFWNGSVWLMYVYSTKDKCTIVARSNDGLNFQYVGPLSVKDHGTVAPVRLADGRYRLYGFSQPSRRSIHSFVSSDCENWVQEPGTRLAAPEGKIITDPYVIRLPDGTWKMIFKLETISVKDIKGIILN